MQILPQARCICPACFEEINLGACDIVSGVTTGKVLKKASLLTNLRIEPLDGPRYNAEQAHRRCPRRECQYSLPYNIERVRSIIVSVVGDVDSGKSHYIASLIRQLSYEWGKALSSSNTSGSIELECLTEDVERDFMSRYLTPLFGSNKFITATPQAVRSNPLAGQPLVDRPLIYKIGIRLPPRYTLNTFNLMIYDTSGEDFRRIERLVQFARFALNSNAFIFVADPFTMDSVYSELPGRLQAMQPNKRRPSSQVLNGVVNSFMRQHRIPNPGRLANVPMAVMVSKADIFTKAIKTPYKYSYYGFASDYYPPYKIGVDLADIEGINQEVINLLETYQEGNLLRSARTLKNVKFFATSATSEPPDGPDHFPSVKPWRCLDPLLWILYQLGVIKSL